MGLSSGRSRRANCACSLPPPPGLNPDLPPLALPAANVKCAPAPSPPPSPPSPPPSPPASPPPPSPPPSPPLPPSPPGPPFLYGGYYESWSDPWKSSAATSRVATLPSYVNVVYISFMQPGGCCTVLYASRSLPSPRIHASTERTATTAAERALRGAGAGIHPACALLASLSCRRDLLWRRHLERHRRAVLQRCVGGQGRHRPAQAEEPQD